MLRLPLVLMSPDEPAAATSPNSPSATPPAAASSPPDASAVEEAFGVSDDDSDLPVDDDLMALASAADPADEDQPKSTPAATPATPPSAAPAAVATPAQPATPAAPAAPAAAAAPVAQAPAQAAPVVPAQPAAAAPAAAEPAQPVAASPSGEVTYDQQRTKYVEDLETKVFNLDPATLDEWDLDKGKMAKGLSNLAARVAVVTMESVIHSVAQQFPTWLHNHNQAREAQDSIKNEFLSAYPALRDHMDKVEPIAVAYRAANPKATRQDAIRAVGEIVHVTHGIPKPNGAAAPAPARTTLPPAQLHGNITPRVAPAAAVVHSNPYEMLVALDAQTDDD